MNKIDNFGETQNVAITMLVDNSADLIVKSTDTVIRFKDEPLLAEHGLAALIDLQDVGTRILWDAGVTKNTLLENMRRMKIDPATIDKIALSHGHGDHTAAITDILKAVGARPKPRKWDKETTVEEIDTWVKNHRVPVVAHPAVFRERWGIRKDGSKFGPWFPPPRAEWEAAGGEIILSEEPYQLGPGCWTTGAVPRLSFEKAGTPERVTYRAGDEFVRDHIDDDQAIVINIQDKGLIVIAGCAHSGIINAITCAQEISGVRELCAVLGGFHLAPAKDDEIRRTIDALIDLQPTLVAPSHCTGFKAVSQFATQMPDEFVLGVVGTKYLF